MTAPEACCSALEGLAFAQVPNAVLTADVSAQAVRLYGVLARHAGTDRTCFPGRRHLARALGVSTADVVDRARRELELHGLVRVDRRFDEDRGVWSSNLYTLLAVTSRAGTTTPNKTTTPGETTSPGETTTPIEATSGVDASARIGSGAGAVGVVPQMRSEREQENESKKGGGSALIGPRRCPKHQRVDSPPRCGDCKDARLAHDGLEAHRRAEAEAAQKASAATHICAHGIYDGMKVTGSGVDASRLCPACEREHPVPIEAAS